jgi:hypothetical protein
MMKQCPWPSCGKWFDAYHKSDVYGPCHRDEANRLKGRVRNRQYMKERRAKRKAFGIKKKCRHRPKPKPPVAIETKPAKNGQDYSHMKDHASSMRKSEVFVPLNLQRMSPDQIVRAFERGLV